MGCARRLCADHQLLRAGALLLEPESAEPNADADSKPSMGYAAGNDTCAHTDACAALIVLEPSAYEQPDHRSADPDSDAHASPDADSHTDAVPDDNCAVESCTGLIVAACAWAKDDSYSHAAAERGCPMNVRIGSLEVTGITLDELDSLVRRYGGPHVSPRAAEPGEEPPVLMPPGFGQGRSIDNPDFQPPDVSSAPAPGNAGEEVAVVAGKRMTKKEIAALRARLAAPSKLPEIE